MKHDWEYQALEQIASIEYGTRVVQKIDGGSIYPVYGGGGATFKIDRYNRENRMIIARFAISKQCTRYVYGKFFLNDSGLTVSSNVENLSQTYLDRCLMAYNDKIYSLGKGAAQKNLEMKAFAKLQIPLPPLSTQQSIVSELDSLSKIIADCKETLKDYDALEQSIFYDMFGDPVKNEKGWEVKKVEDIGSCCSGGTPSRSHPEYFEGDIIWYSAGELNDLYLGESIEKITESALNNSSAKLCKAGSLFVGMYDTAAFKMGIATVDSCSNQACANVTLNDNNNVIWLYFTLLFMKEEALKNRHGARQKNLNLGYIKNFNIPVPPLPLQQQFASKIEAIEQMKVETKKALQEAETLFQARMDYWFG